MPEEKGHSLGLHVNINKCEVFCHSDLSHFPPSMKQSHQPNIEILGIPIGDLDFCTTFISHKHGLAKQLMLQIEEVGALDPQVALMLLRTCSGFCKLSHLARATPPSLSVKALELFDQDVRSCLSQSTSVDLTDVSWNQAQLSLSNALSHASCSSCLHCLRLFIRLWPPVSYPPHPCCGDVQCMCSTS